MPSINSILVTKLRIRIVALYCGASNDVSDVNDVSLNDVSDVSENGFISLEKTSSSGTSIRV